MDTISFCKCEKADVTYLIGIIIAYYLLTNTTNIAFFGCGLEDTTWMVILLVLYFLYQYDLI